MECLLKHANDLFRSYRHRGLLQEAADGYPYQGRSESRAGPLPTLQAPGNGGVADQFIDPLQLVESGRLGPHVRLVSSQSRRAAPGRKSRFRHFEGG